MDMDRTSLGEIFDQKVPEQITSLDNPQPTHNAHQQPKTTETLTNAEQPGVETILNVEKETKKMSTSKPTSPPSNIMSQE